MADTSRCSFCHKAEHVMRRLIPSPSDVNVRVCDECLAVCNAILSDVNPPGPPEQPDRTGHCRLLCDPRLPHLLNMIERWAFAESQHRPSLELLGRARRLALSMMGLDSA